MSYPSSYYDINPIHDTVHLQQMRDIAREQIELLVPQMVNNACNRMMSNLVSGIHSGVEYDCNSILDVFIKDLNKQWHSEELTKFIGTAVREEIQKNLDKIDLTLILK